MSMNENVILEKNENYWDAENVSLQKVTFRYVLDQATALTAYESGEVDGVASIPSSDFARLKAENAGVQTSPSYGTVYYDFNCSAEPVNNVLVRKAICLAIDRQSIIDNVVQVDAQPAYSFLAPATLLMARISPKAAKALACPLPLTLRAPRLPWQRLATPTAKASPL